jgi:nitric oxide dioxygenase
VIAFAAQLTGSGSAPMTDVVNRVAHKHVSLGIKPEQYTVVGHYLLTAVKDVLGDAVTPEVAAAWDEVYWLFAVRLIAAETRLYQRIGIEPEQASSEWTIVGRTAEAHDAVSLLLAPRSGEVPPHRPGQYVTVGVTLPGGIRQARQYSLSHAPGRDALRITVRRVRGRDGSPDGAVSTFLTTIVEIGDTVAVSHPAGDLTLDTESTPVLLASAGIGITPIAAMIEQVAIAQPLRPVVAVHADQAPARHALRDHVERHGARLSSFENILFYENGELPSGARRGLVRADDIPVVPDAVAYLCGPLPFMRDVRNSLLRRGMPAERIHYEVFGADLWTTGADRLPSVAVTASRAEH